MTFITSLVVVSATPEQEDIGSITGTEKVLLRISLRNLSVAVTESGFVPG